MTWDRLGSPDTYGRHAKNQLYYLSDGSLNGEGKTRSRMGYIGMLNGGYIIAESKVAKQIHTASMEIEESAGAWCCKDLVYRRDLLRLLGYPQVSMPTPLYVDNQALKKSQNLRIS